MKARDTSSERFELKSLREMSARIGANPLLVQASSGNTSVKIGEVLWIKASGKWLMHAEEDDFLVPVELPKTKEYFRENTTILETWTESAGGLRASLETAMHAVIPHKVIAHVHSINTIAWAVREDGPSQLSALLSGLAWQWIPYTPSGPSLASKVASVVSCFPQTNVFVLGNHGLVVCGNCCYAAEELLGEVERRLFIEPRSAPEPKYALLKQVISRSSWRLPACGGVHGLATDPISRRILSGGILYPCQAIFLSGIMSVLFDSVPLHEPCCGQTGSSTRPGLLMIEDHGVLASEHMTRADREMLMGLANVVQRIEASVPLRYLTASEVLAVLNGEGASYKRNADTNCRSENSDEGHPMELLSARE